MQNEQRGLWRLYELRDSFMREVCTRRRDGGAKKENMEKTCMGKMSNVGAKEGCKGGRARASRSLRGVIAQYVIKDAQLGGKAARNNLEQLDRESTLVLAIVVRVGEVAPQTASRLGSILRDGVNSSVNDHILDLTLTTISVWLVQNFRAGKG